MQSGDGGAVGVDGGADVAAMVRRRAWLTPWRRAMGLAGVSLVLAAAQLVAGDIDGAAALTMLAGGLLVGYQCGEAESRRARSGR